MYRILAMMNTSLLHRLIADMSFVGWVALIGALLLAMALPSVTLLQLPVSTAVLYLTASARLLQAQR